jgi:hypothetical protein
LLRRTVNTTANTTVNTTVIKTWEVIRWNFVKVYDGVYDDVYDDIYDDIYDDVYDGVYRQSKEGLYGNLGSLLYQRISAKNSNKKNKKKTIIPIIQITLPNVLLSLNFVLFF